MTWNEIRDEIFDKLQDMVFDVITARAGVNEEVTVEEAVNRLDGAKQIAFIAGYVNEEDMRGIWSSTKKMWEKAQEMKTMNRKPMMKKREGAEMKIIETRVWSAESVRQVCIENNLYTRGNNKEYSAMLDKVEKNYAGNEAIYAIAKDIMEHSEGQTVTNIMFLLANKAVTTIFEIVK